MEDVVMMTMGMGMVRKADLVGQYMEIIYQWRQRDRLRRDGGRGDGANRETPAVSDVADVVVE